MRTMLGLWAVVVLAFVALAGCTNPSSSATPGGQSTPSAASGSTASSTRGGAEEAVAPQRVLDTLAKIDAGDWPPKGAAGTKGGTKFGNFEKRLPARGSNGTAVRYTEWDVNIKKANRSRDAERIITGSDGSAWYTLDHYETFTRIR